MTDPSAFAALAQAHGLVVEEGAVRRPAGPRALRRAERRLGRLLAARALERLGVEDREVGRGVSGEPLWPEGVVGSIAHTGGRVLVAVGRAADGVVAVGVDVERTRPVDARLLRRVLAPGEAPPACAGALGTFCAKEAVYKAQFPATGRFLGFADVRLAFGPSGAFRAEALVAEEAVRAAVARLEGVLAGPDGQGFLRALCVARRETTAPL